MKWVRYILLSGIGFCTVLAQAQSNFSNSELEHFRNDFGAFLEKKIRRHYVTGLSVAIEIDNKIVFSDGFGFSNKKENIQATKDTEYPIGSVSKIITSTAILKLYSDGIIDIDSTYKSYVPDFSMRSHFKENEDFTIRHLLSHYAGMPRLLAKGFLKREANNLEALLAKSKAECLIAPPGKVYQYSDWGVDLLALLIERVSGSNYEDYIEETIFKPLGMEHSYFGPAKHVKGYNKGNEINTYEYSYVGSDGAVSSALDILKIVRLYTDNGRYNSLQFFSPEIANEALKRQFVDAELSYDTEVGLMWEIRKLNNAYTRMKFAGIHEPFFTYVFSIPELNASIVICSNSNSSSTIHWEVWGKFYQFLEEKYDLQKNQNLLKNLKKTKKIELSDLEFKTVEGSYNTTMGILEFKKDGDKFSVYLKSEDKKGIGVPYTNGLVKLYQKRLGIKIHTMDVIWEVVDEEVILVEQYERGTRHILGAKISSGFIPDNWKDAVGTYSVSNYGEDEYQVFDEVKLAVNENGILEMSVGVKYPSRMDFQLGLRTISKSEAIIPGYNFNFFAGETVSLTRTSNGNYFINLSGYKFKKL